MRVFAAWSGVTRRDGRITYDLARYNIDARFPGTTALERWVHVRETLKEACRIAADEGVTLALQNHQPIITDYTHMMDFIREVDSPALKAWLDSPLMRLHTAEHYREAICATGDLLVHTHFGGRFERGGRPVQRVPYRPGGYPADDRRSSSCSRRSALRATTAMSCAARW